MKGAHAIIFFLLLASMGLLFYLQTNHIHSYTLAAGIPRNQTILTGPKTFKKCSAHNGKPELRSFTKRHLKLTIIPIMCHRYWLRLKGP